MVEDRHRALDRTRSREEARGLDLVTSGTESSGGAGSRSDLVRDLAVLDVLRRLE